MSNTLPGTQYVLSEQLLRTLLGWLCENGHTQGQSFQSKELPKPGSAGASPGGPVKRTARAVDQTC